MKQVQTQIPVIFQKLNDYDDRFMRVKIWLMHLGENYNGSSFEKDHVEKAIPSLANTPILGFIEENGGVDDYSDHRMILVREDGEYKTKYIGQAYGVIPQENNAKFEVRVGDDGVTREYLTCEGLLWQKWDIPTEIMDRDLVKSQSMELHKDYEGYWNEKTGLFHFTNFKFFGACILGSSVMPGMNSASIEKEFSQASLQLEIQGKMEEFKIAFSRYQESHVDDTNIKSDKEGDDMREKLLALLAKFSLTEDVAQVKELVLDSYATEEELEAKIAQIAEEVAENHSATCASCGQDPCSCEVVQEIETIDEDVVANEFATEIESLKSQLDASKTALESLQAEFDALKTDKEKVDGEFQALTSEAVDLRSFKASTLAEVRQVEEDALFEGFASQLTAEDISSVKEGASELSLEEIEFKLYALVGKKNFQVVKEDKRANTRIEFNKPKDEDDGYGGILQKNLK